MMREGFIHYPIKMLLVLMVLACSTPHAQSPYPGYQGYPGYMPYPYAPRVQQPTPGSQPAYPGWPAQQPAYSQQQQPTATQPPRVEVQLSDVEPYSQQSVILTLEVISSTNLSRLQPELPQTAGLIIKPIQGPVTGARNIGGSREIINTYRYALTPIKSGAMILPAIKVTGTFTGSQQKSFTTQSSGSMVIKAKPPREGVTPWLPLNGLMLQTYLEASEKPEVGKPLNLVVDLSAIGLTGQQLPSLESQLQNSDFKIYRGKNEVKGELSQDGRYLLGNRTERFTLVPLRGGRIHIPELKISWWNVDTDSAETASMPLRQLIAKGDAGPGGETDTSRHSTSDLYIWIPLAVVFATVLGFWILAWLRKKRFMQVVEEEAAVFAAFSLDQLSSFITWLSPIRRAQKVRQVVVRHLPRGLRLWFCIRLVQGEDNPSDWAYMLRFLANKHLGIPAQLSLQKLGQRLSNIHQGSDSAQMGNLMRELDTNLYSPTNDFDFSGWKRRFRSQLRPFPWRRKPSVVRTHPDRLPPLNPTPHG
jgi:hypothetical protein